MNDNSGPADAAIRDFIEASDGTFTAAFDALPIVRQRAIYDAFWRRFHAPHPPGVKMAAVSLPGPAGPLRGLLYRPEPVPPDLAVALYLHGGGWTLGSPESHDIATARLCAQAGIAVLSLDYRLAPEHPFPAALMDALAGLTWLEANAGKLGFDATRLAVIGDSAGANLAAALCLWIRDRGGPMIRFQGLIYPALRCSIEPGQSGGVSPEALSQYLRAYFAGRDLCGDPYVMPLSAKSLENLPPAHVLTAGLDPLESHGRDYAHRLRHAGIPCDYSCRLGLPHAFVRTLHTSPAAAAAFDTLCVAAKRLMSGMTLPNS